MQARLKAQMNKPSKPKYSKRAVAIEKNDPVTKALKFFLGDKSKPTGKKNTPPKMPRRKLPGTPVPLTPRTPRKPGYKLMPKVGPNLTRPKDQQIGPKQMGPAGPKKKSPGVATPKPKAKKPTLDDFLLKGKRPPMKIKPGLKRPSDADVILKGYNDKKTINKYKKGK